MASTVATSLVLPSLNPNAISSGNSKFTSISLFYHSSFKPISASASFSCSLTPFACQPLSSRFVAKVAISSELGEEDTYGEEEDRASFAPDLKLFVGNLPFNVQSSDLADLFGNAGTVEMVEVIYDKNTGRSRGFGFVTMSSPEEAEAAAQQFNGYELEGRALRVNAGPPPPKESSSFRGSRFGGGGASYGGGGGSYGGGGASSGAGNRLYVGNLPWNFDDSALQNLFSEQGKVVEAKVVYDRDSGRSRGFGFVTYSSSEEVNNAIESLDGAEFSGRSIRVSVAESKPRRQF
ncbi:putative ribonucleoprotein chloroplast [Tripterygium wilfordii]|uniref:Putative ribonucleoprotein chloroplast n=1 Tax=Tripterygium wilfordii TaxID=458696 RepID=A0A7J7CTU0_TRIWF|nr:RNA-binding protein CP29B, chloroplastic-like [Tripterygium wilfordii]KAF5737545.1 putative ribonucleoprotein chloroplast [Tripterygium wilfordii]